MSRGTFVKQMDIFASYQNEINKESGIKTYDIYAGHIKVATVKGNEVTILDASLCPKYLYLNKDFDGWLESRCLDLSRANSRILKKVLGIKTTNKREILDSIHGASVTDNYWFKDTNDCSTKYEDTIFQDDSFSNVALYGTFSDNNSISRKTYELSNIGSYEKGWKLIDGIWYLRKRGTPLELESEIFSYRLGKKLGFKMAEYKLDGDAVLSRNFASEYNAEPAFSFLGEDEDEVAWLTLMHSLNDSFVKEYLDILFLDAIVRNPDRHNFNFGLLCSRETGDPICMEPNFDNNLSLFAKGYPTFTYRNDVMVKSFIHLRNSEEELCKVWELPVLNEEIILECAEGLHSLVKGNEISLVDFCMGAYDNIKRGYCLS